MQYVENGSPNIGNYFWFSLFRTHSTIKQNACQNPANFFRIHFRSGYNNLIRIA